MPSPALRTWQLFAIAVAVWGTTWHAIVYQIEHTSPEFGVAVRFALAGAIALGVAAWRGDSLRYGWGAHARFAFQGIFMYSLSYLCVYHAERHVPSGLVAVGYSAAPLVMGLGSRLLWGTPFGRSAKSPPATAGCAAWKTSWAKPGSKRRRFSDGGFHPTIPGPGRGSAGTGIYGRLQHAGTVDTNHWIAAYGVGG